MANISWKRLAFAACVWAAGAAYYKFSVYDAQPGLLPEEQAVVEELGCCLKDPLRSFTMARRGDSAAQYEVALAYVELGGGSRDPNAEVIKWLARSANAGYAVAQNELGVAYKAGHYGVAIDHDQAVELFRLAADQNEEYAQYNLAEYYARGDFIPRDDKKATEYFRQSTDAGYHPSILELSFRAAEGVGMEIDQKLGAELLQRATHGYSKQEYVQERLYAESGSDMDEMVLVIPAIMAIAEQGIHENDSAWEEELYKMAYSIAYQNGPSREFIREITSTKFFFRINGVEGGLFGTQHAEMASKLSDNVVEADVWTDSRLAFRLFRISADMAHKGAQRELVQSYRDGRGTEADFAKADYWQVRAAAPGQQTGVVSQSE